MQSKRWVSIGVSVAAIMLLLSACTIRPHGVLSKKKMIAVLTDLHKVDGIINAQALAYGHDAETAAYYQGALDKHHITQAQFDSSLVWYTDNPQRFNKIYPKVIARLEKENELLKVVAGYEEEIIVKKDFIPNKVDTIVCQTLYGTLPFIIHIEPHEEDLPEVPYRF